MVKTTNLCVQYWSTVVYKTKEVVMKFSVFRLTLCIQSRGFSSKINALAIAPAIILPVV